MLALGRIALLGQLVADAALRELSRLPVHVQVPELVVRLDLVAPDLGRRLLSRLGAGPAPDHLPAALAQTIGNYILSESARIVGMFDPPSDIGLGATPPSVYSADEDDDVVQHNDPPGRPNPRERKIKKCEKQRRKWDEWQAHLYRGMWYPGYMTSIADLTPDDVGLASAYLGGILNQKKCPQSDLARHKQERANFWYRTVHGIEMVAGMVATVVMGIIYGPLGEPLPGSFTERKWPLSIISGRRRPSRTLHSK